MSPQLYGGTSGGTTPVDPVHQEERRAEHLAGRLEQPDVRHRHVGALADDPHRVVLVLERVVHEDRELVRRRRDAGDVLARLAARRPRSRSRRRRASPSDMPLASMPLCSVTFGSAPVGQRAGQPALEQGRDGGGVAGGALELEVGGRPLGHGALPGVTWVSS